MEQEYIIYITLEDGSQEEIEMFADISFSNSELTALAHELVMEKFGDYSEFYINID